MQVSQVLTLARKHLGSGWMESSARAALADAVQSFDAGRFCYAKARALRSLAYSVGMHHEDYKRASA